MKLYRNIKISRKTLLEHKFRTILALIGITIGVAAVIIMVAIGNGAQKEVLDRIQEMGSNLVTVNSGQVKSFAGRKRQIGNVTTLIPKDAAAVAQECPSVALVAPSQSKKMKIKYSNFTTTTNVLGTTSDFLTIRNFTVSNGAFFSDADDKASLRVAVIGKSIQDYLFEGDDPLGEIIRIGKVPFEVIGVLTEKGVNSDGVDEDDQIIIPLNTALRRVFNLTYINTIYVQVKNKESMDPAVQEIGELLRERHRLIKKGKSDDFTIQNQIDVIEAEKETTDAFTLLIAGVAGISLLVGGIGILAIMLITIKERKGEIGLRMAIGARPKEILIQFLAESAMLGVTGGLLGILIGVTGSYSLGILTDWATEISVLSIIISIGFSLSVGLFFGVYPARKASLMDPIDALRSE
ncbi:MAG: ABC transporter permease [Calditrichaceae bacterium]